MSTLIPKILSDNFEQCMKCTICTMYCPVLRVNPLFPGPKQAGPDGERLRLKNPAYYDDTLKYCLNCKQCEVACPSGVRVGDIIQLARYRYGRNHFNLRNYFLANTDLVGTLASKVSRLSNSVLSMNLTKLALDGVLGVSRQRTFPPYTSETFEHWFRKQCLESQTAFSRQVAYFHGCYVNYNFPLLGRQMVEVLNAFGVGVRLLDNECCCGLPQISNGFYKRARHQGERNLGSIRQALGSGCSHILATSSSCCFTLRDEYPHVLLMDNQDVRDSVELVTRYIFRSLERGDFKVAFREDFNASLCYHRPCHLRRMGWEVYTVKLLEMIPGLRLKLLNPVCCGISGTYGFKKENYALSQEVGSELFSQIESSGCQAVCTECETCKWQIEMSTTKKVLHPISVLHEAMDLEKTRALNCPCD